MVLQYRIRLALASLTRILGRARSSLNRWLCSVNRLSFNSDMDCLCGREFIVICMRGRRIDWRGYCGADHRSGCVYMSMMKEWFVRFESGLSRVQRASGDDD